MNKNFSSRILKNIVSIGIALTLILLLFTPLGITAIFKSSLGIVNSSTPMVISMAIYICSVPYIIALFLLKKLCNVIAVKDPFSKKIPIYLNKIAICAFSEILIFNLVQIGLYYFFDIYLYSITCISVIVVSFVSLAIGFLGIVLRKIFEMAIEIKDENDKTI